MFPTHLSIPKPFLKPMRSMKFFAVAVSWMFSRAACCVILAMIGVYCILGASRQKTQNQILREMAADLPDPALQDALAKVDRNVEVGATIAAMRAYRKQYGGAWSRYLLSDFQQESSGHIPYADILTVAFSIHSNESWDEEMGDHFKAYDLLRQAGAEELAHHYADVLAEVQRGGGSVWRTVKRDPFAVVVYEATRSDPSLWEWYERTCSWSREYLSGSLPENGAEGLLALMKELQTREAVFHAFYEEVNGFRTKDASPSSTEDDDDWAGYISYVPFVIEFGDVVEALRSVGAPILESICVLLNGLGESYPAYDRHPDGDSQERMAAELANLYRNHREVWEQAAGESGGGVLRVFRESPEWGEPVILAFGDGYVCEFLLQYYSESPELLIRATEALAKCEEPGWAVLEMCKDNSEFKTLLLNPKVGVRVVPYALAKGPNAAMDDLASNPKWADRYLNEDGTLRKDETLLIETLPFVGGIATCCKNWCKGYPVTMGEIGWAAFDVVDIAVTAATFGAWKAVSAVPAAAAKEGGKNAGKIAVKQAAKQTAKRTASLVNKQGAKLIGAAERKTALRTFKKKILSQSVRSSWVSRGWTLVRSSAKTTFIPVKRFYEGFGRISPKARLFVGKVVTAAMFFVAIRYRTLEKLPAALHGLLAFLGQKIGEVGHSFGSGFADAATEVVREAFGMDGKTGIRTVPMVVGIVALVAFVFVVVGGVRRRHVIRPAW